MNNFQTIVELIDNENINLSHTIFGDIAKEAKSNLSLP